ncbi:class I SAM-dependent methyltransferase [Myxococcota bacterium]|nr:class I SAM-dependent methyltransferase [Myxococcota bacterium]
MSPLNFNRYNKIVDHYAEAWIHLVPAYSQILSIMAEVIRARGLPPQSLLDLGCGTAKATESVAAVCAENAQVTLVDGASQMLDYAKTRLGSAVRNSILADFTDPAWADEIFLKDYYDLALASFSLHHLDDHAKHDTIINLGKSVKTGGILLLADEIVVSRPAGWDMVERIRSHLIHSRLNDGSINEEFWDIETQLDPSEHLPFKPARLDDLTSWMARAGFAVTAPVKILGSALLVGIKMDTNGIKS